MSATIIAFPGRAPHDRALANTDAGPISTRVATSIGALPRGANLGPISTQVPPISATALATKFADHFLPVCQASVDLLEADKDDFEDRCRRMLDADSAAMIDELCAELQIVGRQMQVLVDGLELTRARLRTAVARLTPNYRDYPDSCPVEETLKVNSCFDDGAKSAT